MRFGWNRLALALAVSGMSLSAAPAFAQTTVEDLRVDVNLRDAELLAATRLLTELTGLQFAIKPSEQPFQRINLSLKGARPEDAIRYVCIAAGASFSRDENGVYILSWGKLDEQPATPKFPNVEVPKLVQRIHVLKGDCRDIYDQIVYGQVPDPMRGWDELFRYRQRMESRMTPSIAKPSQFVNQQLSPFYQPLPTTNLPATSGESGNDIRLPGEAANQLEGFGGVGGPTGGRGGQGQPGGGQGGPGGGIGGGLQGSGQGVLQGGTGLVPNGIDFVYFDPATNDLIARGTEEAIQQLQQLVQLFDRAPRQVQVKVEFITTSSSVSKSLGFDWLYERGTVFLGNRPGSFARSGDPFFLNYATGNVTARVRALLQEGFGKVVNAPMVRTLNNQPAFVGANTVTTIFTNQVVSNTGGQVIVVPQINQIQISTRLAVTPRINDDDTITMFLQPQISDFGQIRRGPDGQEVPDQLTQFVSVVARVKNGETIALGGITRNQDVGTHTRFPILGDLPVIGQFFRQKTQEKNLTELLIFVTPVILSEDETGG
ncbi:MAG: hypothetical protein AMXMBFR81_22580 [Chthonomonas sp.]